MLVNFFSSVGNAEREERLLRRTVGGDNRPFIQRITSDAQSNIDQRLQELTNPDALREQKLTDTRDKLQAFQTPDIFTARTNPSTGGKGGNKERLLSMTPARRLEEFTAFVNTQIPQSVRAKYAGLFSTPLNEQDIFEYEQQNQNGRLRIILTALASLNGTKNTPGQNPTADALALDIAAEFNNSAAAPGTVFRLYEQWLDSRPDISETDATTPEILLKSNSGIPDRLRGDLQNLIDPAVQKTMLTEMYELYRNRSTDDNLTLAQARVDQLQLTGSLEIKRIEEASRGLVENFKNAPPALQMSFLLLGAASIWVAMKAKNPIGRWALGAGVGYLTYDYLVNGNQNALNDMGKSGQKFARTGGNIMKNFARELGFPIRRNEMDKLELMAKFITENHMNIPGHEAMTGMSALSGVKLGDIAAAFNPSLDGETLGGSLVIDDGQSQYPDAGNFQFVSLQPRKKELSGNILHRSLMTHMNGMGLSSQEKQNTIAYLKNNNASVSKAITHAMYMLAMDETPNIKRAQDIENAVLEYGSYDVMPQHLRRQYMEIAFQGKNMAQGRYKDQSLVDVISNLTIRKRSKVEKIDDPAVEIPDVKTKARTAEFALIEETSTLPVTTTVAQDILKDGGLAESDTIEFLRNCELSGLMNADAALELARKFDKVRRETPLLSEALQIIEKLKYAILVQSTKQETALSKDDIILLTGPDDLNVTGILNRVTGFLGRYSISLPGRGFGSIASLGDVRSLITEPWFGSGPVQSKGEGFKRLTDRMTIYDTKMAELKDTKAVAAKMAGALPSSMATSFGSKEKLEAFLQTLVASSNYRTRINRAEQHLSQRMANALARAMRLTHESDGFGRFDDLAVTATEQKNLASEFDLLFIEVMGDPLKGQNSMWQTMEDIDINQKFTLATLESFDYATDTKRAEIIEYAKNLSLVYLLQKLSGIDNPTLKADIARRIEKIAEKISEEREKSLRAKIKEVPTTLPKTVAEENERKKQQILNLREALIIENQEGFKDLENILTLFDLSPMKKLNFKDMFPSEWFPEKYEMPKSEMLQFISDAWETYHPIDFYKNYFFGPAAAPASAGSVSTTVSGAPAASTTVSGVPTSTIITLPPGSTVPSGLPVGTTVSGTPAGGSVITLPPGSVIPSGLPVGTTVSGLPSSTSSPSGTPSASSIITLPPGSVIPGGLPAGTTVSGTPAGGSVITLPPGSVIPSGLPAGTILSGTPSTAAMITSGAPAATTTTPSGTPSGTPSPSGAPSSLPDILTSHPEVQRLQAEMNAMTGIRPDFLLHFSLSPDAAFPNTIEYQYSGSASPSQLARSPIASFSGLSAAEVFNRYNTWLGRIDLPDALRELPENKDALTLGLDTPSGIPPGPPPPLPFDLRT